MHSSNPSDQNQAISDAAEQVDFVRLLREHNETPETLYAKVTGDRFAEVLVPFKGNRCAHYSFGKNTNDDFILFRQGAVSELVTASDAATGEPRYAANKLFDVLQQWSNKEYAICVSPAGSEFKHQWLPEHNRTGTVFAVSQRLYMDEIEQSGWTADDDFRPVSSLRIEQRMLGIHPDDPSAPLAEIDCTTSVDSSGVSVRSTVRWLRPVSIAAGYGMMFPIVGTFADKLMTGLGHRYDATATDGSRTYLLDHDRSLSYAYAYEPEGAHGEHETMVAMTVRDIASTFRYGQAGRSSADSLIFLEHRNVNIQKLYPKVYDHHTTQPGDVYEASGVYFIGERPAVAQL
ncbi:MAG: hypothetical protein K0Q73_9314 [Paenibacillus sp.]|jgi:hypothetical protein|nr:hypothetical protein [Paenibacillus sp.]